MRDLIHKIIWSKAGLILIPIFGIIIAGFFAFLVMYIFFILPTT